MRAWIQKHAFVLFVSTLLLSGMFQAYWPYIIHGKEIRQERAGIKIVDGQWLLDKIQNTAQKPTLLFVYASWCTSCRAVGGQLLEMANQGKLSGIEPIFLSVDKQENIAELARYFVMRGYHAQFSSYMLAKGGDAGLASAVGLLGGHFRGGIPYLALFDGHGKLRAEREGVDKLEELPAMLDALGYTPMR